MKVKITRCKLLGRHEQEIYDLPRCKDGYLRKKPVKSFLEGLRGLKGKKVRVEVKDDG